MNTHNNNTMNHTDTIREFDLSLDPKSLRDTYKSTDFDSQFYRLINKNVIKILAPQKIDELHNLAYDEELIYERLICPLEKFICGLSDNSSQDDVQQALASIIALNKPSKLCRRILKTGDVTFACNDCGLDGTCVVCIDCFHKGAHKDHNYRMTNSDGGGCCDCGDPEAWKQNYACTDHMAPDQPNLTLASFEDRQQRESVINTDKKRILETINRLPSGIASRYFMACQASLHYARMLISWTNYDSLPDCLDIDTATDDDPELLDLLAKHNSTNYFTVLYNDEVHTYDFVIGTLVKIIKCNRLTASFMASTVSREGRCLLINDDYEACKHVHDYIATVRDSGQYSEPLKVEVIHGTVLAHQAFAFKLLEWIRKMTTICDSFRILTAYTLLGHHEPIAGLEDGEAEASSEMTSKTLIEKIMLSNTVYWKIARVEWNDLFVKSMLTEYSIKEQFARLLTRLYPKLMQDFMRDDHDPSVSILSMTTQLYTVPSLACMLIEEEKALFVLYKTFSDACNNARRENLPVNFENRKTFDMSLLKRGFHTLMDVKYLLGLQPTKWTNELRNNVVEAVSIVVELLTSLQGMDSVRRQLGNHLEYEPDWESGMSIQTRLSSNISRLIHYCAYDERVLLKILKKAQLRLLKSTGGYKMGCRELFGHKVNCIQYDVSTSPVSVHLPLSRFVVALINELMQRKPCDTTRVPYDESLVILARDDDEEREMKQEQQSSSSPNEAEMDENDAKIDIERTTEVRHSMIDIMEPSLRTCVMVAQFRSGMWRRNGYSLINQINFYHSPPLRKEMFGRDILALQEGGAMCEANQFVIHLLYKFHLLTWSSSETTREPLVNRKSVSFQNDEEIIQHTMSLGEEFLQLLLTIIGERYRIGIGMIEPDDVLKNEIIQLLCMGPLTRSDISHKLAVYNDNELDCIKSIANLKRTTESQTGKYELKEELHERFNPYFYHYIRRDQSNALDAQLKRKRNLGESLICCPPPKPVKLTQQYSNLNQILKCDILLILIQKILTRAIGAPDSNLECASKAPIRFTATDLQLDQCLHLIGMGLYEQEREPLQFNYLQAANEKGIFTTLKGVYEEAKRSKDLIIWLMRKSNDLIDNLVTNYGNQLDSIQTNCLDSIREILGSILSITDTSKQEGKKRNSELATLRRERIMAMMKQNQEKFLSNPSTQQLVAETEKNQVSKSSASCSTPTATVAVAHSSGLIVLKSRRGVGGSAQSGPRLKIKSISGKSTTSTGSETSGTALASSHSRDVACGGGGGGIAMDQSTDSDTQMDCESTHEVNEDCAEDVENEEEGEEEEVCGEAEPTHMCILCRDEQKIGFEQPTMVLLTYIQRSTVLSKSRGTRRIPYHSLTPSNHLRFQNSTPMATSGHRGTTTTTAPDMYSFTSDNSWSFDATHMPSDLFFGPNISTCGHVMHYDCWKGFFNAISKRETSRPNRSARQVSFELQRQEILCPLCECISNATIPLLPNYTRFIYRMSSQTDSKRLALRRNSVFGASPELIEASSDNLSSCLRALRSAVDAYKHVRHIKESQSSSSSTATSIAAANTSHDEKYMRLLQPNNINDALESLNETDALGLRDFINTIRANRIVASMCNNSLLSSISALADRIHSVGLDLDRIGSSDVNHARKFMMTSWSISYTIQAAERAARFKGSPIFEELQSSSSLCLSSLLRFACASTMTHQQDTIQSYLVEKLRYLLINDEYFKSSPCCLDIDPFEMLVSILIALQKLYTHMEDSGINLTKLSSAGGGGNKSSNLADNSQTPPPSQLDLGNCGWTTQAYDHEYFRNLVHLMLVLNMLQVMISLQNELLTPASKTATTVANEDGISSSSEKLSLDSSVLSTFYKEIILASGHSNSQMPKVDGAFVDKIKARLLPFLRSCALYFYHLSQVQPPAVLRTHSAFFEGEDFLEPTTQQPSLAAGLSPMSVNSTILAAPPPLEEDYHKQLDAEAISVEFDAICQYLDLSNKFSNLLKSQEVRHLARAWLRHPRVLVLIEAAISERKLQQQQKMKQCRQQQESQQQQQHLHQSKSAPSITRASLRRSGSSSSSVSSQQQQQQAATSPRTDLMPVKFIPQPHSVNRLIELPHDYSELVDRVSNFTCPSIKNEDSRTPTMCLVCGLMLCSQNYCCQRDLNDLASNYQQVLQRCQQQQQQQRGHNSSSSSSSSRSLNMFGQEAHSPASVRAAVAAATGAGVPPFHGSPGTPQEISLLEFQSDLAGNISSSSSGGAGLSVAPISQQLVGSCTYHAYECSGGVGVFLRIRNCQILLLSGKSKGCYMPAPYIDDHGEFDFGMIRGNPMFLNRRHYEKFQQMWLTHAIPRQISRMLEYSAYASSITWHLH